DGTAAVPRALASLHDALPIYGDPASDARRAPLPAAGGAGDRGHHAPLRAQPRPPHPPSLRARARPERGGDDAVPRAAEDLQRGLDRKSTRLNSSHGSISYAVF